MRRGRHRRGRGVGGGGLGLGMGVGREREEEEERWHQRRQLRVDYYKRGSFYGKPTGCLLFDMAHVLNRDTREHLW